MAHQVIMVEKVLKAFPKSYKITQNHFNKVIELVNEIIAYNEPKAPTTKKEVDE